MRVRDCSGLERVVGQARRKLRQDTVVLDNLTNKLSTLTRQPDPDLGKVAELQREVDAAQHSVDGDEKEVDAAEQALDDCRTGIDDPPRLP